MIHRLLLAACFFASLLPFSVFSEADVVDDSENFALLEEQQATYESPVVRGDNHSYSNSEPALAKDDKQTSRASNNPILLDKIRGLQQEVQELRGQLEVQAHELKLLQEQELSFYKDLDARLRGAPTAKGITSGPATDLNMANIPPATTTPANPTETTAEPVAQPVIQPVSQQGTSNPADEQIRYLAAYELVKNKQFDNALSDMKTFIAKYPHGGYSANAHYWLGELYMVQKNYPQAIEQFNVVLQEFPSSSKSAASLLKTGYALAASGKTAEAHSKLQEVIKNYPDTRTARLAATKLNSLKNQ